jgi:hypothetical protein
VDVYDVTTNTAKIQRQNIYSGDTQGSWISSGSVTYQTNGFYVGSHADTLQIQISWQAESQINVFQSAYTSNVNEDVTDISLGYSGF